jgi:7 transmembrane helices usually fused to an inactive transglutaminase/Inactive transglutaminase fused to 7 transmembrane helices
MGRLHLVILVFVLFTLGLGIAGYKYIFLGFPASPRNKADAYILEGHFSFRSSGGPTKFTYFLPQSNSDFLIIDENFVTQGFGLSMIKDGSNRKAIWAVRNSQGLVDIYYRAVIRRLANATSIGSVLSSAKAPSLPVLDLKDMELQAVKSIAKDIKEMSADSETLLNSLFSKLSSTSKDSDASVLLGRNADDFKRSKVAQSILTYLKIPSRIVKGISLEKESSALPINTNLEVFYNNSWHLVSSSTGSTSNENGFLPLLRGEENIQSIEGAVALKTKLSARIVEQEALGSAIEYTAKIHPAFVEYSLFSLPIEMQNVYRVIIMIPIGALVVVLLRNVIGITTLGTFMPVLIALSFRSTEALWGVVFFVFTVSLALIFRSYLEHLRLLMVPRLGAVLCAIVVIMIATSILTHRMGIERGLSVALFPMVVMTMTVERMSIQWEEMSGMSAIKSCFVTLIIALLVYYVISWEPLRHIMFVFPELLLVVLGTMISLGRYTGYRLLELKRFKGLAEDA